MRFRSLKTRYSLSTKLVHAEVGLSHTEQIIMKGQLRYDKLVASTLNTVVISRSGVVSGLQRGQLKRFNWLKRRMFTI